MSTAIKGYYDGSKVIIDKEEQKNLCIGDELVITILNKNKNQKIETRTEKRRKIISSNAYITPTGRTTKEIDNEIKELRADERC